MGERKRRLLRLLWALVAVGVAFYAGVYFVVTSSFGGSEVVTDNVSAEQLAECSRVMGVTFPPSTRPLGFRAVGGWLDDDLMLKVEMSRDELRAFLDASPFAGRELGRDVIQIDQSPDLSWWNVEVLGEYERKTDQQAFHSDTVELPNVEFLRILVDTRRQDLVIVYLEWFQA